MKLHFQTFDRRNVLGKRRWFFRIVAGNGEPVAQSEAYNSALSRNETLDLIRRDAGDAVVVPK